MKANFKTTPDLTSNRFSTIDVRDMMIDEIALVFHSGESLLISKLYPLLYRTWDKDKRIRLCRLF
jgi:hypothetical protein